MTRKLAVTVFALSLAAFGCGSDEGTPPKLDTAVPQDGPKVVDVMGPDSPTTTPDAPLSPDTTLGPDSPTTTPDTNPAIEAGKTDGPPLSGEVQQVTEAGGNPDTREVGRPEAGPEAGQPDGGAVRLDTQPADTVPSPLDGGADSQVTEAAPALDGGVAFDAEIIG